MTDQGNDTWGSSSGRKSIVNSVRSEDSEELATRTAGEMKTSLALRRQGMPIYASAKGRNWNRHGFFRKYVVCLLDSFPPVAALVHRSVKSDAEFFKGVLLDSDWTHLDLGACNVNLVRGLILSHSVAGHSTVHVTRSYGVHHAPLDFSPRTTIEMSF